MALVLKIQRELKKLDKSKVSPMLDIGFCCFGCLFDGRDVRMGRHQTRKKSDGGKYGNNEN